MVHWVHIAQHVYKFWVRSQVKSYSFSRFSFHISFKKIAQPSSLLLLSPWLISWLLNAPPSFPQLYFHKGRGKITCHAVSGSQRLHSADGLWGQPGQDKEAGQYIGINHVLLSASRTNTSPVIFLINKFLKLFSAPLKIWCLVSCFVHSKYPKPWTDEWQWQMSVTQTQHSRLPSPCSATVFLLPLSWGYVIQKLSQFPQCAMLTHTCRRQYGSLPFRLLPLTNVAPLFLQKVTPEPLPGLGGPLMCTENLSISWH